ncbi:hypothetical protein [Methyloglobulus sp.]|uniref:hypothetical protein n=1 Tax=Methyloglobulus sp. TaxID=2518622 RepID=UPI0032B80B19
MANKTNSRYTVFIPVKVAGSENGKLFTIHCEKITDTEEKAIRDRGGNPVIDKLERSLKSQGKCAYAALEKLLSPEEKQNIPYAKSVLIPDESDGNITEGGSAELGIALAILMHAGKSKDTYVIATGTLDSSDFGNDFDVAITKIDGLPEKFDAILDNHKIKNIKFFLPKANGSEVEEYLSSGGFRQRFVEHSIEIIFVSTLREATHNLGLLDYPYLEQQPMVESKESISRYALYIFILFTVMGFSYVLTIGIGANEKNVQKEEMFKVSFSARNINGENVKGPLVICNPEDDKQTPKIFKKLPTSWPKASISINDNLFLPIHVEKLPNAPSEIASYFILMAYKSPNSELQFVDFDEESTVKEVIERPLGKDFNWWVSFNNIEEEGIQIILVDSKKIEVDKLLEEFNKEFKTSPNGYQNNTRIMRFFSERVQGSTSFIYEMKNLPPTCTD